MLNSCLEVLLLILWSVVIGLSSAAVTKCLRALPPFSRWVFELKKPWACDICMSFWGVVLLSGLLLFQHAYSIYLQPFLGFVAWCVSYSVLHKMSEPSGKIEMPLLLDSGEDDAS